MNPYGSKDNVNTHIGKRREITAAHRNIYINIFEITKIFNKIFYHIHTHPDTETVKT